MIHYLFEDVFYQFKRFFTSDTELDRQFIFDCSFGLIPRKFDNDPDDDDRIIQEEEDEAKEMYFMHDGVVGVAFSLFSNGILDLKLNIAKKL